MSRRSDQRYLVEVAYADDAGFKARLSLYEHQHPRIHLVEEVIASLGVLEGRRVVDVGCGNGQYLGPLRDRGARVVGVDLSPGKLAHAASTTAGRLVDPELLEHLQANIAEIIRREGAFRITTDVALFHARQPR